MVMVKVPDGGIFIASIDHRPPSSGRTFAVVATSPAGLVRPGIAVTITDPVTGRARKGRVVSISTRTKTKGSISGGIYLSMKVHPDHPRAVLGAASGAVAGVRVGTAPAMGALPRNSGGACDNPDPRSFVQLNLFGWHRLYISVLRIC
jgi:hypothetical protein